VSDAGQLTPQQERDLAVAADAGDPVASRQLVEAFLPAISALARGFRAGPGIEHVDLVQEGVAGLLFAARRYDPALETPFWGYATFWVRKAMQELVAGLARPFALSDRAVRGLAALRAAREEHVRAHGVEPTSRELGSLTGFTPAQVDRLLAAGRPPHSLEEPTGAAAGAGTALGERLADPAAESAYEVVLDELEHRQVRHLADRLGERERAVILAHYGIDGGRPRTYRQIGATLGISAERVRQIEVAALRKLRQSLAQPAPDWRTLTR
jgi:RNA polymerase primary sigma factor